MPRHVVLPALLTCALACAAAQAAPADERGCAPDVTCPPEPIAGTVVVDLDYDGLGGTWKDRDGILRSDEIQCAIDCLDGDPQPEHALPLPRGVYDAPPSVAGGTILFPPEDGARLRHELDRPLALPFTRGSLAVRGEGARLRVVAPPLYPYRAAFRRALPASLSPRDVEFLHSYSDRWTFSGLEIVDTNPGNPGPPSIGIEIHGAHHLVIERCLFTGLDRGVDLRSCMLPTIRDCVFAGGRERDIVISDGVDCVERPGRCWTGTEGWLRESGSHQARLSGNHHATHASALAAVHVLRSMNPVIEGCTFEASRPKHLVIMTWPGHAAEMTLRAIYIELSEKPRGTGLVRLECGGLLRVDGLNYTGAHAEETLVDASEAKDVRVSIAGCAFLPAGVRFDNGRNPYANRWLFRDVVAVGQALTAPGRWVGAEAGIPKSLRVEP
jgi:hypothetical protein